MQNCFHWFCIIKSTLQSDGSDSDDSDDAEGDDLGDGDSTADQRGVLDRERKKPAWEDDDDEQIR